MAKQPCKCGRRWFARWHSQHGYAPICPGCDLTVGKCVCRPVDEQASEKVEKRSKESADGE